MKLFKPEDFYEGALDWHSPIGPLPAISSDAACEITNRILLERGVRVYGGEVDDLYSWTKDDRDEHDTHQALLVAIEALPCKHEWESTEFGNDQYGAVRDWCGKCHVLRPIEELPKAECKHERVIPFNVMPVLGTCIDCGLKVCATWEPA